MLSTEKPGLDPRFLVMVLAAGLAAIVTATTVVVGAPLGFAPVVSISFACLAVLAWKTQGSIAPVLSGVGLIGQAIALTAAFAGHPWQLDSHMLFFALMAVLVVLINVRALLVAAGVVVVHHLSLAIVLPALIYPDAGLLPNVARTLFHGAILGVETAALIYVVLVRQRFRAQSEAQAKARNEALQQAEEAKQASEAALAEAEAQKDRLSAVVAKAEAAEKDAIEQGERAAELHRKTQTADAAKRDEQDVLDRERNAVVSALSQGLADLADGDVSARLEKAFSEEFEPLRHNFNAAVEKLAGLLSNVAGYAGDISHESSSIAQAATDMSARTEHQAATLAETAAQIEELTGAVRDAADAASMASRSSDQAQEKASHGGNIVQDAIAAMNKIKQSSGEIAKINGVIEDIAFQTNLLALNAGVEAARAGDAGRGFAVVASEVRALAQRSSDAVRDISALIDLSGQEVSNGVKLVNKTGEALAVIVEEVKAITEQVSEIAKSSSEQSVGFSEINKAVGELDQVTQRNAAMFEETTAASRSLQEIANQLHRAMDAFNTGQGGSTDLRENHLKRAS